ncbi:SGNH/GDSL hydrolase family protein [Shewanella sp.]|uniref:SGNH/GDSL hydrolase family protein n=1 Tax=Shewanella sp. TaxID=50422 RepID=UPI0040539C94
MKNTLKYASRLIPILLCSAFASTSFTAAASNEIQAVSSVQAKQTYTYVRCWYRPQASHDDVSTDWEWALNDDGSYYKLSGYWYSAVSFKNMFYTNDSQTKIMNKCRATLGANHPEADISFFAADNRWSYNHSIWSNTNSVTPSVDKIVSFGDSISDTGNIFNGSQWLFPNANAWFLGHFSNGFVWTEYLAQQEKLPLYNWAVGGAAGSTQYVLLSGILDQVKSYTQYMEYAKSYDPKKTLFTLEFGLNDFINYDRSANAVTADFKRALEKLEDSGAHNILVLNLPDATVAPQFMYSEPGKAALMKQKIDTFNAFARELVTQMQHRGINVQLFDTEELLSNIMQYPANYDLRNTTHACLDINRSSAADYLHSHALRNDCATYGSDSYMFWDVTHPSTKTHRIIAETLASEVMNSFN